MQALHWAVKRDAHTLTFLRPSFRSMGCGLNFRTVGVKRGTGSIGSSMRSPVHDMCTQLESVPLAQTGLNKQPKQHLKR